MSALLKGLGAVSLSGNARVDLSISATPGQTAALTPGIYDLWSTINCYVKVNATADNVTAAAGANAGYLLKADITQPFNVAAGEKIGVVTASGTGTFSYHKVS